MATKEPEKSIPKLDNKLTGQLNYAGWILTIEQYLTMHDIGDEYTYWDLVIGNCPIPEEHPKASSSTESSLSDKTPQPNKEYRRWIKANNFALLKMKKNMEADVAIQIENERLAKEAYSVLKSLYAGKTVTDLGAVIAQVIKMVFDDRKLTIDEHIREYEQKWSNLLATANAADKQKAFAEALVKLAKCDEAKAEFLLMTLPPFYMNTVENIKAKDYSYGDVVNRLRNSIHPKRGRNEGSKDNPIVLRTETLKDRFGRPIDTSKKCKHCQAKGWRGLGHTDSECRNKKKEEEDKKKANRAKTMDEYEGSDSSDSRTSRGQNIC